MKKPMTQKLILTGLFISLAVLGSMLRIGDATLQTMFSCLSGILLGPLWGPLSQFLYVMMGLLGLPVFIEGGGFAYVLHPTFGYLIGMILSSFVTGILTEKTRMNMWWVSTIGLLSVYLVGVPYAYYIMANVTAVGAEKMTFGVTILMTFIVFIPIDFAKLFGVSMIGKRLMPVFRKELFEIDLIDD